MQGFTLVELLVVIALVVALAAIAFTVGLKQVNKGKKIQCLGQFRELGTAMEGFITENQKPPLKPSDATEQRDTVYGDKGGPNHNSLIVASLRGPTSQFPYQGEWADAKTINPSGQQYIDFPYTPDKHKGVADDGRLYDPWGNEIMMAVNTPPYNELEAGGIADKHLFTEGKAVYTETEPREQQYVFWSFGKDGKKGKNAPNIASKVAYTNTDDVISW